MSVEKIWNAALDEKESRRKSHWDGVYSGRRSAETSWYQARPGLSLDMIARAAPESDAPLIDIGGGSSVLVDQLLKRGFSDLSVLDISAEAIKLSRQRLGEDARHVTFIEADVTKFRPDRRYRLWHDRATFHFLTRARDRRAYVNALRAALAPGGQAVIATFAPDGPEQCSGLDVVRYDAGKLGRELGAAFTLAEQAAETHRTPTNRVQKFGYYRFVRE